MYEKEILMVAGGAGLGAAQTFVLSQFVDYDAAGMPVNLVPQIGNFGKPSALIGIAGGAAAIGLSVFAMKTGRFVPDPRVQYAIAAYGGTALVTGALAGMGTDGSAGVSVRRVSAAPRAAPRIAPRVSGGRPDDNIL